MKKLLALSFLASCATPLPTPNETLREAPGLTFERQPTQKWCAFAASKILLSQHGKNVSQCELASWVHGDDCCKEDSIACRQPAHSQDILKKAGASFVVEAPSFARVVSLIKQGKAVTIHHLWNAGTPGATGHAVVAYGTFLAGGRDYITVYDPLIDARRTWNSDYVVGNLAWYGIIFLK